MKRCSLLTLTTILLCGQLSAAVPTAINYQGRLVGTGGNAVPDGNYSIVFTIYDAASGGVNQWTETQLVNTTNGMFRLLLGTVNPLSDAVFSGDRYLGIKVGADPEMTPRSRLVAVPYAERVSTVDGTTGGAISGDIDLDSSTATAGNIYKKGQLFLHNGGGFANTCLGIHAGNLSMSGDRNTAIGLESMQNNSLGEQNTAVGAGALTLNLSGHQNTAAGFGALYKNLGTQNTAVGALSLYSNESGSYNTATGFGALYNNTADGNSAYGHNALINNTIGLYNCAVGKDALYSNSNASENTATGYQALFYNNGLGNTASGYHALLNNTSGAVNTACGYEALKANQTNGANTAFGMQALLQSTGTSNTGVGAHALDQNTSGNTNTALGADANVSVGNLNNATAIGAGAQVNASNKIRLGNPGVSVIEGQVAFTFSSDRNQKENFQTVDGDEILKKIQGLSATSWNYIGQDPQNFRHYGPMAQEFFEAFGHDGLGNSGSPTTINSGDEAGILMIAVQALERRTAEIQTLKKEGAELRARLEKMEAILNKIAGDTAVTNVH